MSQHAVVKACLRYVLFPKERERIPVDGYVSAKEVDGEIRFYEPKIDVVKEKETQE